MIDSHDHLSLTIKILELKLKLLDCQLKLKSKKCPHCGKKIDSMSFAAAAKYAKGGTGTGNP